MAAGPGDTTLVKPLQWSGLPPINLESVRRQRAGVSLLSWALPLLLSIMATTYEYYEHIIVVELPLPYIDFYVEVLVFGIVVPLCAFAGLKYLQKLTERLWEKQEALERLNADLQKMVAERTADLEASNAELRVLDEIKSEFIWLVSHGLRAPLTSLSGGLEVAMQDCGALPEEVRNTLSIMQDETVRLTNFVQRTLDLSRLEAGRLDLVKGPIALRPILSRSVDVIICGDRPIKWDLPERLPIPLGDEAHLEEAIRMVLDNAHRYAPYRTPIEIAVACTDQTMCLAISDHGPGIPDHLQKRIFEKFYRGSQDVHGDGTQGWGLGLYLARRLVEAQGGTLHVESPIWPEESSGGTSLVFSLPLDVEEEEEDVEHPCD